MRAERSGEKREEKERRGEEKFKEISEKSE